MSVATKLSGTVAANAARRSTIWRRRPALEKAVLSIFDQAVYSLTTFLTAVAVGRSVSTSELGIYYLALTIVMVLYGIHENVVAGPYMIYSPRKRGADLEIYTGSMWVHHALLTALAVLAILVMLAVSVTSGDGSFRAGLTTLIFAAPLLLLREGIRRLSFARLQLATAIVLDVSVSVLQIGGLVILWYFERVTVAGVFGVMGAACAIASLGWLALSTESIRVLPDKVLSDGRHNWRFAQWALLSWFTVDTVPFVMPWIVDLSAGTSATGMYGACGTLVGVTNILVVGTGNFLRPKAAHTYSQRGIPALRNVLLLAAVTFILMFGLFTIVMSLLGGMLAEFIYGTSFSGAGGILTTLAANVLAGSLGFIAASGLWAIGRPRASMLADVSLAATTIVAALILVPRHGVWGAAMAALIGSSVGMIIKLSTLAWLMRSLGNAMPRRANHDVPNLAETMHATNPDRTDAPRQRLRISIIVPTYNRSDLLTEALDSALRQTRVPDEIVVVDDGSTDDTAETLARYDAPVVAIRQPNRGVSAARNLAMERATGDILLFLDSDDMLLPRCVERCVEVFETMPEVDAVYSDVVMIDAEGNRLGIFSELEPGPRPSGDLLAELGCRCVTNMTSSAVRRSVLQGVRFDESLPCAQDYEFWCQLASRCHFHYIDECLSAYRYHGDQITTLRVGKMLEEAIIIQRRVMNMPEFARVSRRDRARIYTTHGVKHALCGRTGVARHFFWQAVRTDLTYLPAGVLVGISLGGKHLLGWSLTVRRRIAGNHIEARAIQQAAAGEKPNRGQAVPALDVVVATESVANAAVE